MMKFIYRDKEYSWDEWHIEKKLTEGLELPENLFIEWGLRDHSITHDIGY